MLTDEMVEAAARFMCGGLDPDAIQRSTGEPYWRSYANYATGILTAAQSAGSASGAEGCAVPEGYALIPVEPTREMWAAGGDKVYGYRNRHHDRVVSDIWSAMLRAAPPPPARKGGEG